MRVAAVEFDVVGRDWIFQWLKMRQNRGVRHRTANAGFKLFEQVVSFLHRPLAWHKDVNSDETARTSLTSAQRVIIDTLLPILVKDCDNRCVLVRRKGFVHQT